MKRVATAFLLIPVVVYLVLYASTFWLYAVVSGLTLLALLEYNNLALVKKRDSWFDALGILFGVLTPAVVYRYDLGWFAPLVVCAMFFFFLAGITRPRDLEDALSDVVFKTAGVVYIALPLSYFILLKEMEQGQWWILFFLTVIWFTDSFAYVTGRALGRHALSPVISPKKTVEGAAGGVAAGLVGAFAFNSIVSLEAPLDVVLILAGIISVVSMAGDLAESLLKRAAGVKDSGTIVPGHGGVLDRIDSMLFPAPALYYLLIWLKPL